jgi:hypothetical protein
MCHADSIIWLSVIVNKKTSCSARFFLLFFARFGCGRDGWQHMSLGRFSLAEINAFQQQPRFPGCDLLSPGVLRLE